MAEQDDKPDIIPDVIDDEEVSPTTRALTARTKTKNPKRAGRTNPRGASRAEEITIANCRLLAPFEGRPWSENKCQQPVFLQFNLFVASARKVPARTMTILPSVSRRVGTDDFAAVPLSSVAGQ